MPIEIKQEDIEIERERHEYEPVLGSCDICKVQQAEWEMVFAWRRTFPYIVPSLVTHAFICHWCHQRRDESLEFIRAFLQKQANYRAEQIRKYLVGPEKEEVLDGETQSTNSGHQAGGSAGGRSTPIRPCTTVEEMPDAPGRLRESRCIP